tara:strand:- start:356 stop:715 length:360 start_codon:yes stop_codon:yes gene_type:complete
VIIDGERKVKTFKSKDDVWDIIDLIVEETKQFNKEQGKDFGITESVVSQLPFFACPNVLLDNKIFRDIQRYIYCEKFGTQPYKGTYGEQPYKWVSRAFTIKSALAKKEKKEIENGKKQS